MVLVGAPRPTVSRKTAAIRLCKPARRLIKIDVARGIDKLIFRLRGCVHKVRNQGILGENTRSVMDR